MSLLELSRTQNIEKVHGKNFTAAHAGQFANLHQYEIKHPLLNSPKPGKLFLKDHLGLTSMQISLNKLPAGAEVPFSHAHKQNEEVYIFTGGTGQIQIDGEVIDVSEGSVVRIAPEGVRTWRNNSKSDLYYIVIQARENSLDVDTFEDGIPSQDPVSWK